MSKTSGFTLIELLVAVTILVLATSLVLPNFNFWQRQSALDATTQEIISALRLAQNQTTASEGASPFGIYFEMDKFTVFKGATFYPTSPDNNEHRLNPTLKISEINLGGGNAVLFERLTGNAANYGSVKIEQTSDSAKNKTVFIDYSGLISSVSSLPLDTDRKKDSRHVEVVYSQNAQDATTLSLYFPEAGLTQNINWQTYLNADKTQFDWTGTVAVSGSDQKIRIHTHRLTPADALFCIDRDRRYNTRSLSINLDGQNLINYSATGTTTKGTSLWAGEPQSQ